MDFELKISTEEDSEYVEEKLTGFNYAQVPTLTGEEEDLVFKICDPEGDILAGCVLAIDRWKAADLDILWVAEEYRRQGLGSALLRQAEQAARERGCYLMSLGSFDFQGRPFYEKHGYTLCGTIREWPRGHESYSLMKYLDRPEEEYAPAGTGGWEILPGTDEDSEFLEDALNDYNNAQAPDEHAYRELSRKLVAADGRLAAGTMAGVDGCDAAYLYALWVEEPFRRQGLGTRLLAQFEEEAKAMGAYTALAFNVFDWQTEFFTKHGYTAAAAEDHPRGHALQVMQKML